MRLRFHYILFCAFLILELCTPGKASPQVFGEAARTEFFGGFGVRTFYGRINKTDLLSDGDELAGPLEPNVFVNAVPLAVVYGARPKLSLIAILPTITRTFERTLDGRKTSLTDFGLGDITLFAKYRFYKKDAFLSSRQLALQLGLKLPTGADDLEDEQGNRLPQPLQLGSGSVDYRFVLTFTEARNRWIFTGDLGYDLNTEANHFEFGDVVKYDAAAKFRLHPASFTGTGPFKQHYIFLELNGIVSKKSQARGNEIADSGGHQIFLAPGFQSFILENFLFEAGLQIPILQDLNGTQLGTDFHLRTGIRWIISP